MHNNIKPRLLNKICAHPEFVSCALGACVFYALMYCALGDAPLRAIAPNLQGLLYFWVIVVPAASLLGCILGMLTIWPVIRVICSKINGAPLKPGDQVIVLSGPHKGTISEVYSITRGQGGWELVYMDLGKECNKWCPGMFEEYSLLKINKSE